MIYIEYYVLNPIKINKKKKLDWVILWISKNNYISEYYKYIKNKYEIIDESIDYYITMMEMAIYYLKDYSDYFDYVFVQHEIIIDNEMSKKEDIKERDFSEYLKYLFYKKYDIEYIYKLIDIGSNSFNYHLVFARLLFPSHYLFYLDRVIIYNSDYDKLLNVVKRTSDYEKFLKSIADRMNNYLTKKIRLPF